MARTLYLFNCNIANNLNYKTMNRKIKKIVDECIELSKKTYGTTYFKVLIYGNTGVYYASPIYRHQDYNKSRLFDLDEDSEKLIKYFNSNFNL